MIEYNNGYNKSDVNEEGSHVNKNLRGEKHSSPITDRARAPWCDASFARSRPYNSTSCHEAISSIYKRRFVDYAYVAMNNWTSLSIMFNL